MLYLVSTPIGNLEDITLRALRVLKEATLIASEDTRQTRKLLSRYGLRTRQVSYHEHSPASRLASLVRTLQDGDVALVSDAGTPGISDPGYALVRAAWKNGHDVCPIPGASAPLAAVGARRRPPAPPVGRGCPASSQRSRGRPGAVRYPSCAATSPRTNRAASSPWSSPARCRKRDGARPRCGRGCGGGPGRGAPPPPPP